jgi:hypothetical protein
MGSILSMQPSCHAPLRLVAPCDPLLEVVDRLLILGAGGTGTVAGIVAVKICTKVSEGYPKCKRADTKHKIFFFFFLKKQQQKKKPHAPRRIAEKELGPRFLRVPGGEHRHTERAHRSVLAGGCKFAESVISCSGVDFRANIQT